MPAYTRKKPRTSGGGGTGGGRQQLGAQLLWRWRSYGKRMGMPWWRCTNNGIEQLLLFHPLTIFDVEALPESIELAGPNRVSERVEDAL